MLHPQEVGVCDRCGKLTPLASLVWQFDWRGNTLANLRLRVCTYTCLDVPFQNRRPLLIPPDPAPIKDARPWFYATQNQGGGAFTPPGGSGPTYLDSDGGVLILLPGAPNYPTDPTGLPNGAVWNNGGVVAIAGAPTPAINARPIYFGAITASVLLLLGGGGLPGAGQVVTGSGQLWSNGGEVSIA